MIAKGIPAPEIAARRLAAARLVFRAGMDAYHLGGFGHSDTAVAPKVARRELLEPLRVEDPLVLEALRLDWGSRASIQLVLANSGLLAEVSTQSIVGKTLALEAGPIHGPLFRPSQPLPLPALTEAPFMFAAQQALVRYLHAVVYPEGPKQLGEHDPDQSAWSFIEHLVGWDAAAEVLAYDEVTRDAFAWPLARHRDVWQGLQEVDASVASVLEQAPCLREQGWQLGN